MSKRIVALVLALMICAAPAMAEETGLLNIQGDYRHILLVGLDARPGEDIGRSDVMILLTLDGEHGAVKMVSFLRDLYVSIAGHGENRLNSAWVYGGPELLLDTLERNFGLRVENYVAVDFVLMVDLVDMIGGLEIDITSREQMALINEKVRDTNEELGLNREYGLLTETGRQTLDGRQVLAYMRYRKTESDFSRTQRQRQVIDLMMAKAGDLSLLEMARMAATILSRMRTNLTVSDVIGMIPTALKLRSLQLKQLRIPLDGAYVSRVIDGMDVLVPDLEKARDSLEEFIAE